jgi:iron(III) transport system ATP-binding protein
MNIRRNDAHRHPSEEQGPASIEAAGITKRFGGVPVLRDVSVRVDAGQILALLGPSGCGKTTLLRTIAGLETPDAGEIRVGSRVLTGGSRAVPPEQRRVGMVFQDWALFPHMTVGANVGYGLPRSRRASRVEEALAMVGLEGLAGRMPGTLSGGQQQRVALARALAPRPRAILLDEPFSNLDSALRVQIRTEVHRLLRELAITTIFVTHDQEEAFVLGDEVAVMRRGEVVQQATPSGLYAEPASPWVATFVGDANLVDGVADGRTARTTLGVVPLSAERRGPVQVLLRPEMLATQAGDDGVVEIVEFYGHDTVYHVRLDAGPGLLVRAGSAPLHRRGDRVGVRYVGSPAPSYAGEGGDGRAGATTTGPDAVPAERPAHLLVP